MRVGGIVLCGGRSSRMGQPKAWLPIAGQSMLNHVVAIVSEVVEPVIVVAAPGQALPPLPQEVDIVRDEREGRGPLQGLASGLEALSKRVDAAFLSSCDVPFLLPAFVRRIVSLIGEHAACVPFVEGRYHPLAAVYRIDVLKNVRELLASDRLRPACLFEAVPTRVVKRSDLLDIDPVMQSLRNLNTPADYEAALRDRHEL
jgi:molybdopterin-guanine dinucleotide biosynthesis protein A